MSQIWPSPTSWTCPMCGAYFVDYMAYIDHVNHAHIVVEVEPKNGVEPSHDHHDDKVVEYYNGKNIRYCSVLGRYVVEFANVWYDFSTMDECKAFVDDKQGVPPVVPTPPTPVPPPISVPILPVGDSLKKIAVLTGVGLIFGVLVVESVRLRHAV